MLVARVNLWAAGVNMGWIKKLILCGVFNSHKPAFSDVFSGFNTDSVCLRCDNEITKRTEVSIVNFFGDVMDTYKWVRK